MEWTLGTKKVAVIGIAVLGVAVAAGVLMGEGSSPTPGSACESDDVRIVSPGQGRVTGEKIGSDGVVWTRPYRNESGRLTNADIFVYRFMEDDLKRVAGGPDLQSAPEIFGSVAVWKRLGERSADIRAHNLSNGTTWTLPVDVEGNKAPRGLWQDRLLVEGPDSLYVYNLSSQETTQVTDYDPGVSEIWEDRVVWRNMTGQEGNVTFRLMLYDVATNRKRAVLNTSVGLTRPDIYRDQIVYSKRASDALTATWEVWRYDLSTGTEHPVATNDDVVANRENPRIAGDWIIHGVGDGAGSPDDLQEGMGAYHVPSGEWVYVVEAGNPVFGDVWQNKVVYVRFDECTDFKQQVALTTLPETP